MQAPVAYVRIEATATGRGPWTHRRTMPVPAERKGTGSVSERGSKPGGEMDRNIEALLSEDRVFEPPEGFREQAVAGDPAIYDRASEDYQAFWAERARELTWMRPWDTVMEWNAPWVTWFAGGRLNASANCLDRHVEAGGGEKVAFYWEGEPGDTRVITYEDLLDEVSKLANALRGLGVRKGDRVNIYLGMVPE